MVGGKQSSVTPGNARWDSAERLWPGRGDGRGSGCWAPHCVSPSINGLHLSFFEEVGVARKLLDGRWRNMLSSRRMKYLMVMENLCLANITKHKMTWYIHCCVTGFLVYRTCYRAMATQPEIGAMSILLVKMMMVIKQFVNCWSFTSLHIRYHVAALLVAWGSVKRGEWGSLTETHHKNTMFCYGTVR